jgi:hypothetical protein
MEKDGGDVQVRCCEVGQSPSGAAIEEEPGVENVPQVIVRFAIAYSLGFIRRKD